MSWNTSGKGAHWGEIPAALSHWTKAIPQAGCSHQLHHQTHSSILRGTSSRSFGGRGAASGRLRTRRALVSTLALCPRAMVLVRDRSHSPARAPGQVHSAASQPHAQPHHLHFCPLKCCNEAVPQRVLSLFSPTSSTFCIFQRKNSMAAV